MSGNTRKNQVTRLVTLRHRSIMSGALGLVPAPDFLRLSDGTVLPGWLSRLISVIAAAGGSSRMVVAAFPTELAGMPGRAAAARSKQRR